VINLFDFYNLPVKLAIDQATLKKEFFEKSKKYHPDFFANATDEEQRAALEQSTVNTVAYKTLSNEDLRLEYILKQAGLINDEEKPSLPPDFLMEVMEMNEEVMELQFDFDPEVFKRLDGRAAHYEKELSEEKKQASHQFDHFENEEDRMKALQVLKNLYYKSKYLLRLRQTLNTFAQ
jgi:molecular chaperone HscB